MAAARFDLPTTYTGDDVSHTFTFTSDGTTPINITGRTYTMKAFDAQGNVDATFTCTVPTGTDGKVAVTLGNTTTTALGVGSWHYSLVENASGVITTLVVGSFTIADEATG